MNKKILWALVTLFILPFVINFIAWIVIGCVAAYSYVFTGGAIWLVANGFENWWMLMIITLCWAIPASVAVTFINLEL